MICSMVLFIENKMWNIFLLKFRCRYCFVSVIMRPACYFISPHFAHGGIWVWDPKVSPIGCPHIAAWSFAVIILTRNQFKCVCFESVRHFRALVSPYVTSVHLWTFGLLSVRGQLKLSAMFCRRSPERARQRAISTPVVPKQQARDVVSYKSSSDDVKLPEIKSDGGSPAVAQVRPRAVSEAVTTEKGVFCGSFFGPHKWTPKWKECCLNSSVTWICVWFLFFSFFSTSFFLYLFFSAFFLFFLFFCTFFLSLILFFILFFVRLVRNGTVRRVSMAGAAQHWFRVNTPPSIPANNTTRRTSRAGLVEFGVKWRTFREGWELSERSHC